MEDLVATSEPAPAIIPESAPVAEAPRWGLDESFTVVDAPAPTTPTGATITSESLGSAMDKPAPLDKDGNVSDEYVQHLAQKMTRTRAPRAAKTMPAELKDFAQRGWTLDDVKNTLASVEDLYDPTTNGVATALSAIYSADPATYGRVYADLISNDPHFALRSLETMGYLPQGISEPTTNKIPWGIVQLVPDHLIETAKQVPGRDLVEWADMGEEVLTYNLEKEAAALEAWNEGRERARQQEEAALASAQQAGQQVLAKWHNYYVNSHYDEFLDKWRPFDDERVNGRLRRMAFTAALDELIADPQWANLHAAMVTMFTTTPLYRFYNKHEIADEYDREALSLCERFNTRLRQVMRAVISDLSAVFKSRPAKSAPQDEESDIPERPPTLNANGDVSDAYITWLARYGKQETAKAQGA
jgi:hypothetical protein